MADKQTCKCGTETNVKKDGNLWRHQTPDGVQCDGQVAEHDNSGTLPEGPAEAVNETPQPEKVEVPEVKDEEPTDVGPVFEIEVTVPKSLESMMDSPKWHQANRELTSVKAKKAGKSPQGEATLTDQFEEDGKIVLVYSVSVEG